MTGSINRVQNVNVTLGDTQTNWIESLNDPNFRLNNLYKITNKQGQLVTFTENPIQKQLNKIQSNRKIILKARQFGISTNEIIKAFDFCALGKNKNVCILSHEQKSLEKLFNIVRVAHKYMDQRLAPVLDKGGGSKYEMRFPELNSKIYADLESRSDTIHWLHVSEAAFADTNRIKGTLEAVPLDGIITLESTPNGLGNYFYQQWLDSGFKKVFLPWFFHSEYILDPQTVKEITTEEQEFITKTKEHFGIDISLAQIAFRRQKQKDLREMFIQEYPEDDTSCFLSSGFAACDLIHVSKLLKKTQKPDDRETLVRYEETRNNNHVYVIGADTAEGVNKDSSTFTVLNITTRKIAAQFKSNNIKPRAFAHKINEVAQLFRNRHGMPLLGVELNNHGHAVVMELNEHIQYENLYHFKEDRPGWKTDSVTRPLMVDAFIDALENETVHINDYWTLVECLTLINNDGKIEANDGYNDDCVISCALAIQMMIHVGAKGYDDSQKILV